MFYTKEDIENIIRQAFNEGEDWGAAYTGWFEPSSEQKENQVQEIISKIFATVR